jgi:hypothetical protein
VKIIQVVVHLIVVELSVRFVLARESATQAARLCGGCVRTSMKLRRKTYVRHQPIKTLQIDLVRLGMGPSCVRDHCDPHQKAPKSYELRRYDNTCKSETDGETNTNALSTTIF